VVALVQILGLAVLSLASTSCFKVFTTTCKEEDRSCLSNPLFALDVGGVCTRDADCKDGLYCTSGMCAARGDSKTGETCRLTAECGDKDYCGSKRTCALAGIAGVGQKCVTTADCKHLLVCEAPDIAKLDRISLTALAGISGMCKKGGTKKQGDKCDAVSDCLAGLSCYEIQAGSGKHCVTLPASDTEPPALLPPLWSGSKCPTVAATDTKQTYFEVPRGGKPLAEFYALPFPNDIRRKDGHIDLTGHPTAPNSFGLPIVARYVDVAQTDLDGFSTNPVVSFRFSHAYDQKSVQCVEGGECTIRIVDITKTSPDYNSKASLEWKTTENKVTNYVCPHWLALRRPVGSPLKPNTTYAAVITNGIQPVGGGSFARGADFAAMLAPSAPDDTDLKAAYDAYAPLRAWIADTNQNEEGILSAAVFTTQSVDTLVPKLRDQARKDGVPKISDWTVCTSASTKSPCEDADGRGKCSADSSDFTEIHAHIRLPIFQQGTAPYLNPEDGGGIEVDGSGDPIVQDHQDVCMAISVPQAAPPAAGYPVLVFAHGTGGSFAGEMNKNGFAQVAATATTPSVLVAIDMPEHGSRRGDSTDSPEDLFYNFLNPRAARDNVLQGSADLFSVVNWVKQGGVTGGELPSVGGVPFDVSRVALMGHSQGSTHASVMVAYEPDVTGVVLSGNGGHLSTSMLTKTSPVDIAKVVPFGLLDPDNMLNLAGDAYNPALAIIQSVFDRADPINYARHLYVAPTTQAPDGHHAFMTYGLGDTYAPEETQVAYARAAVLTAVEPILTDKLGLKTAPAPLSDNVPVGGVTRTVGLRQYQPKNGEDGHFVGVTAGQDGRVDVEHYLDLLLDGQAPAIGK
jgi:pimeloyl-ACP methyl ester carboxylesterase